MKVPPQSLYICFSIFFSFKQRIGHNKHFVDELEGRNRIKVALADIGTHALLKMMLVDNFIHADMHPGNILVREALNKSSQKRLLKSKPHVVFFDVSRTA